MSGVVHLVGAGPGDPELLTLRAARLLADADVVLVDRLVGEGVLDMVSPAAEVICVGKSPGDDQEAAQERIMALMVERCRGGAMVVRLKGGDPMVFGRGAEEVLRLAAAGLEVTVTPGVSSVLAAASGGQFGLTHRGISSAFAVVAGTGVGDLDWRRYAAVDTLVILMGVARRRQIAAELIAAGRPGSEPVMFVESASMPDERRTPSTLAGVEAGEVQVASPAVWVVGQVVSAMASQGLERAG